MAVLDVCVHFKGDTLEEGDPPLGTACYCSAVAAELINSDRASQHVVRKGVRVGAIPEVEVKRLQHFSEKRSPRNSTRWNKRTHDASIR
jgi:hypothetical protein